MSDVDIHSLPLTAGGVTIWQDYVLAADYNALRQQLAEREQERNDAIHRCNDEYKGSQLLLAQLQSQREELANLRDTLRGIASMPITEGAHMAQWAKDGLSGFTEPLESTVLKLQNELARVTAERDRLSNPIEHADYFAPQILELELDHARLREAIEFAMTDYTSHSDDDIACLEVSDRDHQVWAKFKAALADRRTP